MQSVLTPAELPSFTSLPCRDELNALDCKEEEEGEWEGEGRGNFLYI